jgi:hypothetical protein
MEMPNDNFDFETIKRFELDQHIIWSYIPYWNRLELYLKAYRVIQCSYCLDLLAIKKELLSCCHVHSKL